MLQPGPFLDGEIKTAIKICGKIWDPVDREHMCTIFVGLFRRADKGFDPRGFRRSVECNHITTATKSGKRSSGSVGVNAASVR